MALNKVHADRKQSEDSQAYNGKRRKHRNSLTYLFWSWHQAALDSDQRPQLFPICTAWGENMCSRPEMFYGKFYPSMLYSSAKGIGMDILRSI